MEIFFIDDEPCGASFYFTGITDDQKEKYLKDLYNKEPDLKNKGLKAYIKKDGNILHIKIFTDEMYDHFVEANGSIDNDDYF